MEIELLNTATDRNVTLYAIIAAFGGFVFGLDIVNLSGAIRFVSSQFELNEVQIGLVGSSAIIGVLIALLFTGPLCDWLGRRAVLLVIACLYSLSSIISATAISFEMLVLGRMIGGLAFASLTVSAMYIGEIAPKEKRGSFVGIQQLMIAIGTLVAFLINYFLVQAMDTSSWLNNENIWRVMLGSELIANVIWVSALLIIPRSPRWLLKKGFVDEARDVLARTISSDEIETTVSEVKESLDEDGKNGLKEQISILFSKRMVWVLAIAIVYAITQGASGMNAVNAFAPQVFEQVGMGLKDTFKQTIGIGLIGVIGAVLSIMFIEKIGRRLLTIGGLVLIVIAHGLSWYSFSTATYNLDEAAIVAIEEQGVDASNLSQFVGTVYDTDVALKADLSQVYDLKEMPLVSGTIINETITINATFVLIGIFLFLGAFFLTIGPIMWVVFSEIFANNVRAVAIPFVALIQSISAVAIQQLFPWQLKNMGAADIFFSYGLVAFVGLIILFFILPETKGKSLEEIEDQLVKSQ